MKNESKKISLESPWAVDLHLSKALFSLDPDNLQLHCFLGCEPLFCCSFFCPLDQPCKTLQMVQEAPKEEPEISCAEGCDSNQIRENIFFKVG